MFEDVDGMEVFVNPDRVILSYHIRNVPVSATIEMSRCGFHQAVEKIGVFMC